jgi:hypothetical protein
MGLFPFTGSVTAANLAGLPWAPADDGLLAASMDPMSAGSTQVMTAGTVYLMKINIRSSITATNVVFAVTTAGSGASTGSFAGLYNSAGTLLSGSADNGASLVTAQTVVTPLTTPQVLAASTFVWVVLLVNLAVTQPSLAKSAVSSGGANINLAAASFRVAANGTGQTALPASITPASNTGTGSFAFLVGLS